MEKWDAYDMDFSRIEGVSLIRGEPVPNGCFHLVCEVVVRHSDGCYLLMQRDKRKPFGGLWELTAGGSALQGESASECAARELTEETGIVPDSLTEIGRMIHYEYKTIFVEFLCDTNWEKNRITLQEGETTDYKWVSSSEIRSMPKSEFATHRTQLFIKGMLC